jgi:hypothetical protein
MKMGNSRKQEYTTKLRDKHASKYNGKEGDIMVHILQEIKVLSNIVVMRRNLLLVVGNTARQFTPLSAISCM